MIGPIELEKHIVLILSKFLFSYFISSSLDLALSLLLK